MPHSRHTLVRKHQASPPAHVSQNTSASPALLNLLYSSGISPLVSVILNQFYMKTISQPSISLSLQTFTTPYFTTPSRSTVLISHPSDSSNSSRHSRHHSRWYNKNAWTLRLPIFSPPPHAPTHSLSLIYLNAHLIQTIYFVRTCAARYSAQIYIYIYISFINRSCYY